MTFREEGVRENRFYINVETVTLCVLMASPSVFLLIKVTRARPQPFHQPCTLAIESQCKGWNLPSAGLLLLLLVRHQDTVCL